MVKYNNMSFIFILLFSALIIACSSLIYKPKISLFEVERLAKAERQYKNLAKFYQLYPILNMLCRMIANASIVFLAVSATCGYGWFYGSLIALILIPFSKIIGKKLSGISNNIVSQNIRFLNKYFNWVAVLKPLVKSTKKLPIASKEELISYIKLSKLEEKDKLAAIDSLKNEDQTIEPAVTKWSNVEKLNVREKLTPGRLDELFKTNQTVFPVTKKDANEILGVVYLSDIQLIGQSEKELSNVMRNSFASLEISDNPREAYKKMAEAQSTTAIVYKGKNIYGLVNLSNLV